MDEKKPRDLNELSEEIYYIKWLISNIENSEYAYLSISYMSRYGNFLHINHPYFEEIYKRHFEEILKEMKEVYNELQREFESL